MSHEERAAKDLGVWFADQVRLDDCPKEVIFRALVGKYERLQEVEQARAKWQYAWQEATWQRNQARREIAQLRQPVEDSASPSQPPEVEAHRDQEKKS